MTKKNGRLQLSPVTLAIIFAFSAVLALRAVASYRSAGHALLGDGSGSGPAAVFERTEQDVGVVAAGEVLPVAFPVRNPGSQRLVLTPGDCFTCARKAGLETVIVPPGGAGEVVVTLRTANVTGDVRQVARYTTSDPQHPQVEFVVTGRVK